MKEVVGEVFSKLHGLSIGCSKYSKQYDTGNGRDVDMCTVNNRKCEFWDGSYMTRGVTVPDSMYDRPIVKGEVVGFCRRQRDTVHLGPIVIWDKLHLKGHK